MKRQLIAGIFVGFSLALIGAAHIKGEQAKWSKVIREAHVRIE